MYIVDPETGQRICADSDPNKLGTVLGPVYDYGYGSLTRCEYFQQLQPNTITQRQESLKERLRLIALKHKARELPVDQLADYVLDNFLAPLKKVNPELALKLKSEVLQKVL